MVVEAALRSGTTSTATSAHTLNRPVLAVPGPVSSPLSAGCHALIREQRAVLAAHWPDVVDVLGALDGEPRPGRDLLPRATDALTHEQHQVLDSLPLRSGLTLDAVVRESGLPVGTVLAALGVLTAIGLARQSGDAWHAVRA